MRDPLDGALARVQKDPWGWVSRRLVEEESESSDKKHKALVLHELGTLLERRRGDIGGAGKAYGKAVKTNPGLFPNLWAVRRILAARKKWDNVLKLLDAEIKLTKEQGRLVDLWLEKGRIYESELKHPDSAREAYQKAHELEPERLEPVVVLERILGAEGNVDALMEMARKQAQISSSPARRAAVLQQVTRLMGEVGGYDYSERRGLLLEALEAFRAGGAEHQHEAPSEEDEAPSAEADAATAKDGAPSAEADAATAEGEAPSAEAKAPSEVESVAEGEESVLWDLTRLAVMEGEYEHVFELLGERASIAESQGRAGEALALRRQQARVAFCRLDSPERAWEILWPLRGAAEAEDALFRGDLLTLAWVGGRWSELQELLEATLQGEEAPEAEVLAAEFERYLVLRLQGRDERADEALETLRERFPDSLSVLLTSEKRALETGDLGGLAEATEGLVRAMGKGGWGQREEETKSARAALKTLQAHLILERLHAERGEGGQESPEIGSEAEAGEEAEGDEEDKVENPPDPEADSRRPSSRQRLEEAARLCNEALALDPDHQPACFLLEDLWGRLAMWDPLTSWLKDRVERETGLEKARVLETMAEISRVHSDSREGEVWALRKLVGEEPDNELHRWRFMDALARDERWAEAGVALEELAASLMDPAQAAQVYVFAAHLGWLREEDAKKAAARLRKAKEAVPEHRVATVMLEDLLWDSGDWNALLMFYEEEAERSLVEDEIQRLLINKGEILELRLGREKEALEVYEDLAERFPDSPSAQLLRARGFHGGADDGELAALMEREAEGTLDEKAQSELLMLASSYYESAGSEEQRERATACLDRAFTLTPGDRALVEKLVLQALMKENWARLSEVLETHLLALQAGEGGSATGETWRREATELMAWATELALGDVGQAWQKWEEIGACDVVAGGRPREDAAETGEEKGEAGEEEGEAGEEKGEAGEETNEEGQEGEGETPSEEPPQQPERPGALDVSDGPISLLGWAGIRQAVRDRDLEELRKRTLELAQSASMELGESLKMRALIHEAISQTTPELGRGEGDHEEMDAKWAPRADLGRFLSLLLGPRGGEQEADILRERAEADGTASWLFASAVCACAQGQRGEASAYLARVLERNPRHFAAAWMALELAREAGDVRARAASAHRLGILTTDPESSADLFQEAGDHFLEGGDPVKARESFEAVLAMRPESDEAYTQLRKLLEAEEAPEPLIKLLSHRLAVRKDEIEEAALYRSRGAIYLEKLKEPRKAAADLHRAVRARPGDLEASVLLARLYAEDGDTDKAKELLTGALQDPGVEGEAETESAREGAGEGGEREKGEDRARWIREGRILLAEIHERFDGDLEAAEKLWKDLIGESPQKEDLERVLAFYVRGRRWDSAVETLDAIQRLADTPEAEAMVLRRKARLYRELMANEAKANEALERAREKVPGDVLPVERLAKSYKKLNKKRELEALLEEAVKEQVERLGDHPTQAAVYRDLMTLRVLAGEPFEQRVTLAALSLVEELSQEEREQLSTLYHGGTGAISKPMTDEIWAGTFMVGEVEAQEPWDLWQAMRNGVTKIYAEDLGARGVGRSHRLEPSNLTGVGKVISKTMGLFGVEAHQYYRWAGNPEEVRVTFTSDGVVVLIGASLLAEAQEMDVATAYRLGLGAAAAKLGVLPIIERSVEDVKRLFDAVTAESYSDHSPSYPESELGTLGKSVRKAMGWMERRGLSGPSEKLSKAGGVDVVGPWMEGIRRTCLRAALVLSGDLVQCGLQAGGVGEDMRETWPKMPAEKKRTWVKEHPWVVELMRFAVSDEMKETRSSLGL